MLTLGSPRRIKLCEIDFEDELLLVVMLLQFMWTLRRTRGMVLLVTILIAFSERERVVCGIISAILLIAEKVLSDLQRCLSYSSLYTRFAVSCL